MRVFEHPNKKGGFECPLCGTGADKPVVLVGEVGTEKDGIVQARQVHLDCLSLQGVFTSKNVLIYMFREKEVKND